VCRRGYFVDVMGVFCFPVYHRNLNNYSHNTAWPGLSVKMCHRLSNYASWFIVMIDNNSWMVGGFIKKALVQILQRSTFQGHRGNIILY
jgi:hypothetical protein